jgi:hypothetical protein
MTESLVISIHGEEGASTTGFALVEVAEARWASMTHVADVGKGGLPSRMICLANHDAAVAAARTVMPPCPKVGDPQGAGGRDGGVKPPHRNAASPECTGFTKPGHPREERSASGFYFAR